MKNYCLDEWYEAASNCTRDSPFSGCDCPCSECMGFLVSLFILMLVIFGLWVVYLFVHWCLEMLFKGCFILGKCCFKLGKWCYSKVVACSSELDDEAELVPV